MATPIRLEIEARKHDDLAVYYSDEFDLDLSQNVLFSFMETDNIFVKFHFNDQEYTIFIEPYSDDSEYIAVNSGQEINLSTGRDDLGCYFPGYFNVLITDSNETHECLFFVKPKNLRYENIVEIRKYVNDFYYGLSKDLLKKKRANEEYSDREGLPNISNNISYLISHMPTIINVINIYIKERYVEIEKQEQVTKSVKKINARSIKWLSQKGMAKNENPNSPGLVLTAKSVPLLDNTQNQIFKREVLFWNNELAKAIQIVNKYKDNLLLDLNRLKTEIQDNQTLLTQAREDRVVSKNVIKDAEKKAVYQKEEQDNLLKYLHDYNNTITRLKQYKMSLEYILFNSWIKMVKEYENIQTSVSSVKLKMLLLYKGEYRGIKKITSSKSGDIVGYAEKCTPKLFETYIYIMLINMLRARGYEMDTVTAETNDLLFTLSNASKITLSTSDGSCDIIYDLALKKSNAKFTESEYCSVSSRHNRPDFILSFKGEDGKIEKTVVVETKWRSKHVIYSETADTGVVENLTDYFNLAYRSVENKKTYRGIISKVIVLYPDYEESVLQIQENEIIGIGIIPSEDIESSKGYLRLCNEIIE